MKWKTAILAALFISLTVQARSQLTFDNRVYPESQPQILRTKEGFQIGSPRASFMKAWDATFAMTAGDQIATGLSASVLVFKQQVGSSVYLGFLTSGHSIRELSKKAPTDKWILARNIRSREKLEVIEAVPGEILHPIVNSVYELGFFVKKVPAIDADSFQPVMLPNTCMERRGDRVVLFGFPGVFQRDIDQQREKIAAPDLVIKRTSEGVLTGETRFSPKQTARFAPLYGTTADAMEGNSGGPALDENGNLIGILVGSFADLSNNAYRGFEGQNLLRAHSFITGCRATKNFASGEWAEFQKTLPIEL